MINSKKDFLRINNEYCLHKTIEKKSIREIKYSILHHVSFIGCNFPTTKIIDSSLKHCEFINCCFAGLMVESSKIENTDIKHL